MKNAIAVAALLAASVWTAPARANDPTATPTATAATVVCTRTPPPAAPPCGSARVRLNWFSKRPDVMTMSVSATHCPMPAACATSAPFSAVTTAPAVVEITDSACHSFSATFAAAALNTTGCPGKDFYKSDSDKLRLIYGAETTALGFLRLALTDPGSVPALTPPLTYRISDAAGYAIEGTLGTCFLTESDTSLRLKCF